MKQKIPHQWLKMLCQIFIVFFLKLLGSKFVILEPFYAKYLSKLHFQRVLQGRVKLSPCIPFSAYLYLLFRKITKNFWVGDKLCFLLENFLDIFARLKAFFFLPHWTQHIFPWKRSYKKRAQSRITHVNFQRGKRLQKGVEMKILKKKMLNR